MVESGHSSFPKSGHSFIFRWPAFAAAALALRTGFLPEDKGPYDVTPNTVELIPTLGALFPRGGPVQDPVLTLTIVRGTPFRRELRKTLKEPIRRTQSTRGNRRSRYFKPNYIE